MIRKKRPRVRLRGFLGLRDGLTGSTSRPSYARARLWRPEAAGARFQGRRACETRGGSGSYLRRVCASYHGQVLEADLLAAGGAVRSGVQDGTASVLELRCGDAVPAVRVAPLLEGGEYGEQGPARFREDVFVARRMFAVAPPFHDMRPSPADAAVWTAASGRARRRRRSRRSAGCRRAARARSAANGVPRRRLPRRSQNRHGVSVQIQYSLC